MFYCMKLLIYFVMKKDVNKFLKIYNKLIDIATKIKIYDPDKPLPKTYCGIKTIIKNELYNYKNKLLIIKYVRCSPSKIIY